MPLFEQLRNLNIWDVRISAEGIDMKKTYSTIAFDVFLCNKEETETIVLCVFLILWNSKIYQVKGENDLMLIGLWKLLLDMLGLWGLSHSSINPVSASDLQLDIEHVNKLDNTEHI